MSNDVLRTFQNNLVLFNVQHKPAQWDSDERLEYHIYIAKCEIICSLPWQGIKPNNRSANFLSRIRKRGKEVSK